MTKKANKAKKMMAKLISAGISKKEINKEIEKLGNIPSGFVTEEAKLVLVAKKLGVGNIEIPTTIRSDMIRECIDSTISSIYDAEDDNGNIPDVNISGYIINEYDGETAGGNPKKGLSISDGENRISVSIHGDCLTQYEELGLELFDKIKLEKAGIYEYEVKDDKIRMLSCGKFTIPIKIKGKDIHSVIEAYDDVEEEAFCIASGLVLDTSSNTYSGCPECSKKIEEGDDIDCQCGYSGPPVELTITHAGIISGHKGIEDSIDITMFPRTGILPEDIAFKPITVLGVKKKENCMNATSVKIEGEGVVEGHQEHFGKPVPKMKDIESRKEYIDFKESTNELLSFYDEGMDKKEFLKIIGRTFSEISDKKVRKYYKKMMKEDYVKEKGSNVLLA